MKGAIPTLVCQTKEEVNGWQEKLEKAGIAIEKRAGPGISSDGKHIPTLYNLFVRDPAGYLVEFQVFLDPTWPAVERPLATAAGAALIGLSAAAVVDRLAMGTLTPTQCIDAFLAHHTQTEAAVNAVPILCVERARAAAATLAAKSPPSPLPPGYLHGLPIVVKDLSAVAGVRFTKGSPILRDNIAEVSDPIVLTLEANGAIVVGKSNTPEFGAGSQTFNPIFGATHNPFDVRRTAGGSSGGAAAALASGVSWLATGSDLGGSLRIPASFCSVYGFRVSPGRVGRPTPSGPFLKLHSINGPMARSVEDLAMFLDSMVDYAAAPRQPGWEFDAPFNFPAGACCYRDCVVAATTSGTLRSGCPQRVAWSADLNGLCAGSIDRETLELCHNAAQWFGAATAANGMGAILAEGACPDLSQSRTVFQVLRGESFAKDRAADYKHSKPELKPEVIWNIEVGQQAASHADGASLANVRAAHHQLFAGVEAFFESHDMLVTPCVVTEPFDVNIRYPSHVSKEGGDSAPTAAQFGTYIDWMVLSWATTVVWSPSAHSHKPNGIYCCFLTTTPSQGAHCRLVCTNRVHATDT